MRTPFFLSRPILAVAAVALLTIAAGCQCTPPPASPTPAPTKDTNDYKGTNGPHPASASRHRRPIVKMNGPHPGSPSAPAPSPTATPAM